MVENRHAFEFFEEPGSSETFRIEFSDGEVIVVRSCQRIDASIYGKPDGWSASVVDLATADAWRRRLFPVGGGVDFYESDIRKVWSGSSGRLLYSHV